MNTNPFTCDGTPFNFQPEYNTARAQNFVPRTIGVHMIGHWESCTSVTGRGTYTNGEVQGHPLQALLAAGSARHP